MDLGVRGKGYLLVGGSAGIGLAAASALAADGAAVAIAGRDEARAAGAATALRADHAAHVVALSGDVTIPGEAERLVAEAAAALGSLRGVAVTTGLGARGQRDLLRATDADWHDTFEDVLLGTVRVCRAVVPRLVESGGGSIVTTAAYSIHSPKPHHAEALERAMVEDWGMRVALGRAGTPREAGDVIAFLLSERASYLTGALVNVDGGTDF